MKKAPQPESQDETMNRDKLNRDKLIRQLFIGKVSELIGFEKTLELLKESKNAFDSMTKK